MTSWERTPSPGAIRPLRSGEREDGENFPHTPPSAVLGVRDTDPVKRERSFVVLAQRYWKPIYKYIRLRWRTTAIDAEEFTQEFFLRAMEKNVFAGFDPQRARFRTFVRVCADRFVASYQRHRHAKKRGGGMAFVSFDFGAAEIELGAEREDALTIDAEALFEAEWVKSLLQSAVAWLREDCVRKGKGVHFRAFELFHLTEESERPSYEAIAEQLGISLGDVNNRLVYARRHFRAAILMALRECTASEEEMNDEARIVLGASF
ncbi:sigma-70 family RNA polymerase sigma factor [Pendulispora rubella]|uniref:Sigma-70 family RNA polymerase sigma factor n=1 Tax=Pendulispora rubella TaxID=2741070 RepID=A0ABZ2KQ22_9BACT